MRRLADGEKIQPGESLWFAYLETTEAGTWFNNAGYIDALNPAAVEKFAQVTYDAYARVLGDHLGTTVPAIFTDEPQLSWVSVPDRGGEADDILLSWTDDFPQSYRKRFGLDVLDDLPLVVWDQADGSPAPARWRYHDHRSQRFAQAYSGTLGPRARAMNLALTGHLMSEDSLESQVAWTGESMRSYSHFDIPGIDLLCDDDLPATAKQTVSVARQQGKNAVLSELYGVTGWTFDFSGHKRQGDWQAALGITVRVPHLSWMTMAGEAKRDYPAAIDWHSPWWEEYSLVEDHFARLNTALTRGKPVVRVAVVHPVETAWLQYGPRDGTGAGLVQQEKLFQDLTKTLIENLIDFDYLSEALVPELHRSRTDPRFGMGEMAYDVVLVPDCTTLRSTTVAALKEFADRGGTLLVLGQAPRRIDGKPDQSSLTWFQGHPSFRAVARTLASAAIDLAAVVVALEPWREVRARRSDGSPGCRLYSQVRQDGEARWLFVCDPERGGTGQGPVRLAMKGSWSVERFDTLSGTSSKVDAGFQDGWTEWLWQARPAGSELVRLVPATPGNQTTPEAPSSQGLGTLRMLAGPFAYRLEEPNVLVLDRAEYRVNGRGDWKKAEEILRLDNLVRSELGLAPVHGDIAQPWSEPPAEVVGSVDLRFQIDTEVTVTGARLALEQWTTSRVSLDGQLVSSAEGFWVDECLVTVPLPPLAPGRHELVVTQQVRRDTTREWCYLLGNFGVRLDTDRRAAVLTRLPDTLAVGDLTIQGFPFYGGNVVLTTEIPVAKPGTLQVDIGAFPGPLVKVALDARPGVPVAFAPFQADLGRVAAGLHTLEIKVFGNRHNSFGPLHLVFTPGFKWLGPDCYRTEGELWSDAWQLRPTGLAGPVILREKGD